MPLLGRERELAAIDGLIERLQRREGGCLLIEGEPGIGKSALLDAAAARARQRDIEVLTTAGVASEAPMAFAALHRLLRPGLRRSRQLPEPQRVALEAAFGLSDGAAPDRFLIALAALELVADAAAESPLLVLVEDAHWLDQDTSDVLAFIARRIDLEPIVVLFAARDDRSGGLGHADLPSLGLAGLDDVTSEQLLERNAPGLSAPARKRLLETACGNPLALLELPRARAPNTPIDAPRFAPPPITDTLQRAFSDRLTVLPPVTQDVLLIAALDDGGQLAKILHAASSLRRHPVGVGELGPAEAAGLIEVSDAQVRFRHPLVRAAVVHAALASARQGAHAALADAYLTDPDRSPWHRAAASPGYDDDVAAELAAAGTRALHRGSPAVAAAAFERAADLTADAQARGGLLLRAAEMHFELGLAERARHSLSRAEPLALAERERARLTLLFEAANEEGWAGPDRVAAFAQIAGRMVSADDPERAIWALLAVARDCWWGNARQDTRSLVVASAERLDLPGDSPALIAVRACADPVHNAADVIERLSGITPDPGGDPAAMHLLGTAATTVWAFDTAVRFLDAAIEGLRGQGRLGLLAQALVSQAWAAVHAAKATLAVSAAVEAAALARETGQERWALAADLAQAMIAGERGDFGKAAPLIDRAETELQELGAEPMLSMVQFARGRAAVAHHHYEDGYAHLRRILEPGDIAYHQFVGSWALADLIEAAACSGRHDEAVEQFGRLESLAERTNGPLLRASVAYVRPILAADEEAEPLFVDALEKVSRWPCYRARLLLLYGRWLRRQRRVADSRVPLRAALAAAGALSFDGLADAAAQELRASGEGSRGRAPAARDELTPQELQIAQLASQGLSNREIGQRLYLSHRTVGSHLYRMFPKLGITSRAQIGDALAPPAEPSAVLGAPPATSHGRGDADQAAVG